MTNSETREGRGQSPTFQTLLAVVALLLIGLSLWLAHEGKKKERAIRDLPVADRRALYERTLTNYRTLCAPTMRAEMKERCQQDAEFLALFPECDASCRELISALWPQPKR